jgi:hypothetical protein
MLYYRLYKKLALLLILLSSIQKLSIDFITRLLTIIRDSEKVDIILIIVNRYTKISFFITVNIIINTNKLAKVFYKKIKCK